VLDLRGLRCPALVLRAKETLRRLPVGTVLVLECTDPLAVIDVPVFAHRNGDRLAAEERRGDVLVFRIVKLAR
jgi:tRNA 2-thiouridine synthesizing protein A